MINIVYLVIFIIANNSHVSSQIIPQANYKQCQINARMYNSSSGVERPDPDPNIRTEAQCVVGVK